MAFSHKHRATRTYQGLLQLPVYTESKQETDLIASWGLHVGRRGLVAGATHARSRNPTRAGLGHTDGLLAGRAMVERAIVQISDCPLSL